MSNSTLSKKLASVKPGTMFVGIDLALDRNVAVVLTEHAEQLARFGFPNDREGYDYFYRRLEAIQESQQAPAVLVGMEPTNYFWKLMAGDMEQYRPDYSYRLVNPYTVKKNREGDQLDRSKDDNRDAFTIGDLLRSGKYRDTAIARWIRRTATVCDTLHPPATRRPTAEDTDPQRCWTVVSRAAAGVQRSFWQDGGGHVEPSRVGRSNTRDV